ncbi:Large proline-rich protein BAG6 [Acropora cervicornis]|uniref:Large proline-rich protein BAG6 n=1 Tax=Acropora cervicornis TaxID=6130 RepID=A0AAD9QRJ6_ACRCE|nr:Large proline-rich protein BAG6 [Acropora cervicornis]
MDENTREIFVQLLLRNIRQMYYSRAYCYPRLERFMVHAPPPPPPSEEQPPSKETVNAPPEAGAIVDQSSTETSISDALMQAVTASGVTPLTSMEDLSKAARDNKTLQGAYRNEVKKEVKTRLKNDKDYRGERFPNTRDYFDQDTP